MVGTVGFADIYGPPAGGPSVATATNPTGRGVGSAAASKLPSIAGVGLPMELPALVVLGVLAWFLWHTYD